MPGACAIFLWAPFFGPGDVIAFAAITVLSGFARGANLSRPRAIQADVADMDAAETEEQRAGAYFAVWSEAAQATAAAALLALDLAGFDAAAASPPGALLTLALLCSAAPVALELAAVALVWRFPLDSKAQAAARARIEA